MDPNVIIVVVVVVDVAVVVVAVVVVDAVDDVVEGSEDVVGEVWRRDVVGRASGRRRWAPETGED